MSETVRMIDPARLCPFSENPFQMREIDTLAGSIADAGVIVPLIVRTRADGELEIIDGHRRALAAQSAEVAKVPALVRDMDDDTAVIALVDSNLHRESLLPSEKAHAFKMKMEALRHQGKACGTGFHKSRDGISDDMTGRQVSSYIRLTELVPELLDMVDEGLMAIKPAVELSYLTPDAQRQALGQMEANCCTPSHAQARRIRALNEQGRLTEKAMGTIMAEDKPNQAEQLRLPLERLKGYFPKSYTPREMADTIVRLLEQWQRKRERQSRDAR